ncbi:MAG: MmoB/DmpM family protein [Zhongshania sp.]|uniref:MmoB/DmpM family protein n=1 Tax=Zhongshania sp. TaxID=1971902 RepID=UPI00262F17D6|nr:MmoB/DmpM family protein [Zhongshania sp.]MDF1693950.1 MmoB/DmpM family protein [Zhongshania sp.]
MSTIKANHTVSAKLMGGEEAGIICDLMEELHEHVDIIDSGSYVSIETQQEELIFDMEEITEVMGHSYSVSNFLSILTTYKGFIEVNDDNVVIRDNG